MKHFFKQIKEWNGVTYFFLIITPQTWCCYGLEGNNPYQPYTSYETVLEQRAYSQEGIK
ncbi:hypothetical protein [Thermococcus sp.]